VTGSQSSERTHLLIEPPSAQDWTRGPAGAPLTLIEYGDYQCPACQHAFEEVERLLVEESERIRLVYRHFPLMSIHPRAMAAAQAAQAAGQQGKFWEMHRKLFAAKGRLEEDDLRRYAGECFLEMKRFEEDCLDEEIAQRIRQQKLVGVRSGVNGTPTFFMNGRRYDGEATFPALRAAVKNLKEITDDS
jgi:protein-disulfide isomerase